VTVPQLITKFSEKCKERDILVFALSISKIRVMKFGFILPVKGLCEDISRAEVGQR
jgi:hypothetical protein